MASEVIPEFSERRLPFTDGQTLAEQCASGQFDELVWGLLNPTQQRLNALVYHLQGANGLSTRSDAKIAAEDLNGHYSQNVVGSLAVNGFMMVVKGELVNPVVDEAYPITPMTSAKSAAMYLTTLASVPLDPYLGIYYGKPNARRLVGGLDIASSLDSGRGKGIGIRDLSPVDRALRAEVPTAKWAQTIKVTAGTLNTLNRRYADATKAKGLYNLGGVLQQITIQSADIAVEAVKKDSYVDPILRVRPPREPKIKEARHEPVVHELNDPLVDRFFEKLGIRPMPAKQLKQHPLAGVLKHGGRVTLGKQYEFSGFGDAAPLAASFLENIATVADNAETVTVDGIVAMLNEAEAILRTHISPEAKKNLSTLVETIKRCTHIDFCQVAVNHRLPAHDITKRAVQRLGILRERISPSIA